MYRAAGLLRFSALRRIFARYPEVFLLDRLGANGVWVECVDIFAWVFLWEAVDQFFIERGLLLLKRKRDLAFIRIEINFYPACRPDEFSAGNRSSV